MPFLRALFLRLSLVCVALFGLPNLLQAETPAEGAWPVPRGEAREANPYTFNPAIIKIIPRDFLEDAAACILYASTTHTVEADGTIETVTHEITRLNGRKGVEKIGEYRNLLYTPSYQKLTLNTAVVHKPNGKIFAVRPRDVQLRDVSTDFSTYDPDKQLIITFPSLEVGDTIEVKWTVRGKNPEHAGQFFTRYSFGDPSFPVVLDELRVRVPLDKTLKYASTPDKLTPTITVGEGRNAWRTFHWKQTNCPKLPKDDDLPSREELRSSVVCSTFTSWEAVGAWKHRLREECWKCTPLVVAQVKEITKGLSTPQSKAAALTYWVRRNIRYVSVGERHDYTPHSPDTVLANRFGDCKDGSQLLAVMLREAGFKVELATLGVQDDGQVHADVPSPWGTHAILLVSIAGKEHWIDTTAKLGAWDELPYDDCDRLCYLTDDKGQVRLLRTPPLVASDSRWEQHTEMWLGSDGGAYCKRSVVAFGSAAVNQRDRFDEVPPGEQRRQVASELQDANSRTHLLKLNIEEAGLRNPDKSVRVQMDFEIPRFFTGTTDLEGSVTDSRVWARLLSHNLDHDRTVPLVLYSPFESIHRYVIHISPAHVLEDMPRAKTLTSKWGEFRVEVKANEEGESVRHFEFTFHTRIDKVRVEPADFAAFRKFHEDVSREYRVWLTLRPATDRASIPLLETQLLLDPQDGVAAGVLAKIYHANGKASEAIRTLKRIRHYRPDDAKLLELAVKYADGFASEEEAERELVKRFPEKLEHQLALGSVLVTRNKQAEARKILTPLTSKGSANSRAQAHFHLARSHYRKDELPQALENLDQASKLDADALSNVRALMLKGQVLEEMGKVAEAFAAYRLALIVERENLEVLLSLIRLAIILDNRAEALNYLRRYSLLVDGDMSGLLLAAEAYLKLGRLDEASDLAGRARDQGFHEKSQRILGLVALARGDEGRAIRHLENAEADATVLAALMRAYLNIGNLREASALVEKSTRIEKPTPELERMREAVRRVEKRRAELGKLVAIPRGKEGEWSPGLNAVACAEEAQARGRTSTQVETLLAPAFADGLQIAPASSLRALLSLERGKLSKALADAEVALRLNPREGLAYLVRGRVRLERETPGSLPDLERAVELTGRQNPDALAALAEALQRAGKMAQALATQREAVKLRPADRELSAQLAVLEKAISVKPPMP